MTDTAEIKERLKGNFSDLIKDTQALLNAIGGDVDEKTKEARAKLAESLEIAKKKYSLTDEDFRHRVQKTDEIIHQYPYHAVGISFVFGMLLGLVLTKK
jgi:ElaB/YqjD/DUF883 family membrane-anchored ribosome-binding protein